MSSPVKSTMHQWQDVGDGVWLAEPVPTLSTTSHPPLSPEIPQPLRDASPAVPAPDASPTPAPTPAPTVPTKSFRRIVKRPTLPKRQRSLSPLIVDSSPSLDARFIEIAASVFRGPILSHGSSSEDVVMGESDGA